MNKLMRFIRFFLNREFVLFIIIGGINTLSGVFFSYIYSLGMTVNLAFMAGYLTGLLISYLLNSLVNFKTRLSLTKFFKFAISYVPNFIIQNIIVFIVYNTMKADKLIAYVLAAVLGIPITFFCVKIFAFKNKEKKCD